MPPKKTKIIDENGEEADRSLLSVDDYTLPRSMILRLAKGVLPSNTQIQKDALTAILKSATVFVNYLASNSDDRAQLANKKTIRPEDVFGALEEVEFGEFVDRVRAELNKYQDIQNNKRNDYRRRVKGDGDGDGDQGADAGGASGGGHDDDTASADSRREKSTTPRVVRLGNGDTADNTDADEPPAAKRARRSTLEGWSMSGGDADDDDGTLSDEAEYQSAEEDVGDEEDGEIEDDDEDDAGADEDDEDGEGRDGDGLDDSDTGQASGKPRGYGNPLDYETEEEDEDD